MFEYHQDILCIYASALYNKDLYNDVQALKKELKNCLESSMKVAISNDLEQLKKEYKQSALTYVTRYNYDALLRKKHIKRERLGGNGREALINYDMLPDRLRLAIEEMHGNPYETIHNRTFVDELQYDDNANDFFRNYTKPNGNSLSETAIKKYNCRVSILNAVHRIKNDNRLYRRVRSGGNNTKFWHQMVSVIQDLPEKKYPHAFGSNPVSLSRVYSKYINNGGLKSIVHKGEGNLNPQIIKGDVADWLLAQYCLPNKMTVTLIMLKYKTERELHKWGELSESAVKNWLNKLEQQRIWVLPRHGKEEYQKRFSHHLKRDKEAWFPNVYWAIDGTKLDWLHYYDNALGMAAKLKIDVVFDLFSEKILGWSFSESESHIDHFTAVKMAFETAQTKPMLFTYDNQSGHKSKMMQPLYDKIVSTNGGTHYPHRPNAHNSPVESLFNRLQQQEINQWWFSDGQSIKVRNINNAPNMDTIKGNKERLHTKEMLLNAWKICVNNWNESKHSKYKEMSKNEVFLFPNPKEQKVDTMDFVDMFWLSPRSLVTYRKGGIQIEVSKEKYLYEVYDSDNRIDTDFRQKYVGAKLKVKYDPENLDDFIYLYQVDAQEKETFVGYASPKRGHETVPALMQEGDKQGFLEDYKTRDVELERDAKAYLELAERTGIDEDSLIDEQELIMKMGGDVPKDIRSKAEEWDIMSDI